MKKRNAYLGGVCAAALAGFMFVEVVPALAQIDEIIVYSRKREESLQSVPIAVTAFDEARIDQIKPKTLRDFDGLIPNVQIGQTTAVGRGGAIFFRGQGYADVEKTQNPPVGVVVDGVFFGTNTGQLIDAFDIESIEFLRGPQGVLFGKNTTGGAINVRRSRPTGELGFKGSAAYGNYQTRIFKGVFNAPVVQDKLALKVGGTIRRSNGFYTNIVSGDEDGGINYRSMNVALKWDPIQDVEVLFQWDRQIDTSRIQPNDNLFLDGLTPPAFPLGAPIQLNPFNTAADFVAPIDFRTDILSAEVNWDSPIGRFTSITAYMDSEDLVFQDFDASNESVPVFPLFELETIRDQAYQQFTQEVRLDGSVLEDRLEYTLGFYYYEHAISLRQETDNVGALPPAILGAGTCGTVPALAGGPLMSLFTTPFELCLTGNAQTLQLSAEDNEAWALFASLSYALTDRITLNGGIRYTDEDKSSPESVFTLVSGFSPAGASQTNPAASQSISNTTYKVGIEYQHNDDLLGYFNYTNGGFRSGGISIRAVIPAHQVYSPEFVNSFEGGFKSEWFDNKVRFNAAGFFTRVSDEQFTSVIFDPVAFLPGTSTLVNNVDEVRLWGAEAEGTAQVHDYVTLRGSFGWLDYMREGTLPCARVATAATCAMTANAPVVLDGTNRTRSPRFTYALGGVVSFPMGPGTLTGSLDYKFIDDHFVVTAATGGEEIEQKGYGLFDMAVTYDWEFNGVEFGASVIGKNLSNEVYLVNALSGGFSGTGFGGFGDPRTILGEVSVRF